MTDLAIQATVPANSDASSRAAVLKRLHAGDNAFRLLTKGAAILVLVILGGVIVSLISGGWQAFSTFKFGFVTTEVWNPVTEKFGALAPIYGTIVTSAVAMLIATPIGLLIALFLTELCPTWLRRPIGIAIELLAGIPSIIYGIWGLFMFAPFLQRTLQPFLINTFGNVPLLSDFFAGPPYGIGILTAGLILAIVVLAVILLGNSVFVVRETERALMLQFGRIVRSDIAPGIHWKLPIVNQVKRFDGRVLTVDGAPGSFFTVERKRLIVDSFAKWRVADVETYYKATGGVEQATKSRLADRINDGLRNEFGTRTLYEVVSGERDRLMADMTSTLNDAVRKSLGVEVLDVRVRRIDLPPEVSDQVYQRMTAERDKEAQELRAVGLEAAEKIRAEADRQVTVIGADAYGKAEQIRGEGDAAAARIYAAAYQRDPEFYAFTRSLKAYRAALADRNSLLVLEPDSDFFRYLKTPDGAKK